MKRPIRKRAKNYLRIFLVECPGPIDAMESRSESSGVASLARLIGHAVHSMPVRSLRELQEACAYIGSISAVDREDLTKPLCLHLSAHGANDGLLFGGDDVDWQTMLKVIQPILSHKYTGSRILILSSCEADQQKLTREIKTAVTKNKRLIAPRYIFCATGSVSWPNAAVGWTLLYHLIPSINLNDREQVQGMLDKIKAIDAARFTYFRWDDESGSYKRFPSAKGGATC